jgi:hypothetical protein
MHETANITNHEAEQASRWQRMANVAKRHLAPLAIAAVGVATLPVVVNTDEALAGQSHPVFRFRDANQGDYGARMATTGCGPTSLGMVAPTLTNNP